MAAGAGAPEGEAEAGGGGEDKLNDNIKTTHQYRGYVFTLEYQGQDPAYIVDFPDIPEIITSGATLPEAFASACEALDPHLESLQKLGQPPPESKHHLIVEVG